MVAGWSTDATRALIAIWGEENIQQNLDGVTRNKTIFEKIAAAMKEKGYDFDYKQCRTKVKNLKAKYNKVKDNNRGTGNNRQTCPFFEELDAILAVRATSDPTLIIENTSGSSVRDQEELDDSNPLESSYSSSSTVVEPADGSTTTINDMVEATEETPPPSQSNQNAQSVPDQDKQLQAKFEKIRGKKRKRGDAEDLILKIAKIDEEAEKKAEEREKRWLESEDRREKERRDHEDRHAQMMMSMFSGFMTQLGGMMMCQPPGPMPSFPHVYPPFSHTVNHTFPGQDFIPNYRCETLTDSSSVDDDPELETNVQSD